MESASLAQVLTQDAWSATMTITSSLTVIGTARFAPTICTWFLQTERGVFLSFQTARFLLMSNQLDLRLMLTMSTGSALDARLVLSELSLAEFSFVKTASMLWTTVKSAIQEEDACNASLVGSLPTTRRDARVLTLTVLPILPFTTTMEMTISAMSVTLTSIGTLRLSNVLLVQPYQDAVSVRMPPPVRLVMPTYYSCLTRAVARLD